jgi:release factor glutamine methyltransferase
VGTGSGCIAVSLAKHFDNAIIHAIDISPKALFIANKNAKQNNVTVHFIEHDILDVKSDFLLPEFNIIVSNPPYVTPAEKEKMQRNVLLYEPHQALFVTQKQPLVFYERIADFAGSHFRDKGYLYFEINALYGREICEMLRQKGYENVELIQDISGRDRIVCAER